MKKRHDLCTLAILGGLSLSLVCAPSEGSPHRVLVLYSFGLREFSELHDAFDDELQRLSPETVETFDVPFEAARFADRASEGPFVDYLKARFTEPPIDVLVAVAGPAARFSLARRETLFPSSKLVIAGVDSRVLTETPRPGDVVAVPVVLDFPPVIENILTVRPSTTEVAVVLGGSAISALWLSETERAFQPFSDRVRFTWLHHLSLETMRERVASLPRHAAVLFLEYGDAAGIANDTERALQSLCAASSAPVFGMFESQLGLGIVGGPLLSEAEVGRRAAAAVHRLLSDEAPQSIPSEPVTLGRPVYDYRELARWRIAESALPPGSRVAFRPPALWNEHRGLLLLGIGFAGLQTALIAGLLLQRSHRRAAEDEAHALARRLLTAHEDERTRLARELHDDFGQRLARLAIDAAGVERGLSGSESSEPGESPARAMRDGLVRLGDDVQSLSYQLHPSVLHDLGLKDALEVECARFSRRESIRAHVVSHELPTDLPSEISVCLFRIAQEALRNVARHSLAREVTVSLARSEGMLRMTVTDNGVGFEPGRRNKRSLGHASMMERASLVGGKLEIESAPGKGTTIRVLVPLPGASS
jgi:signal transduction histidine kinase